MWGAEATVRSAPPAGAEFFGRLRSAFDDAAARAGGVREHRLGIGPWGVRVQFAGPELEPLMLPPLEHLRPSLNWILDSPSRYFAHAACVGNEEGAVLVAGKGGSGKTTTTMASVEAGLSFLADNYVLVSLDEGGPVAYSLYSNAKLLPATVELLPGLREFVDVREVAADEKLTVDIREHRPEQLATGLPVRALVVPH